MAEPGTLFSYLSAFITIVLAVAFADMAASLHRLLNARKRVQWHPIPLAVAAFVLLTLATQFFSLWDLTRIERVNYYQLLWLLAPQFVYFLAASAVLPDEVPDEGLDLLAWYMQQKSYLFAVLGFALMLDAIGAIIDYWASVVAHPEFYWGFFVPVNLAMLALIGILWRARKPWIYATALAALFAVAYVGFGGWSIKGAPAVDAKIARSPF